MLKRIGLKINQLKINGLLELEYLVNGIEQEDLKQYI